MDIASPYVVVPVMLVIFLSCILTATLTGRNKQFYETPPDDSNPRPDAH